MKRFVAFLILLAWSSASAQTTSTDAAIPNLRVEKHQLANGLEVLLVEQHRIPRVAVALWYHVGPMNEEPGRTGFAHLFEHMMFQTSRHVPEDQFFRILEAAGANDINGTTDNDRTNYFETVPSNELELALWLESDRMGYLLETVDAASLRNQQDVVRNERRQSLENRPFGVVEESMIQNIYPAGHPYHGNVIGSHQDIQAAKLDDVRAFFKQYYTPNNASLAIVGDFDKANTLKLVDKYFGSLKRGPDVPPVRVVTPPITAEKRIVVKDRVEIPRLYMAWLAPGIFKPGEPEAAIAAGILGGGKSSRLYKSLVYDKKIAQDVYADIWRYALGSVFMIQATPLPDHTLEELEREIDAQLDALRAQDPAPAEVERAEAAIESDIIFSLERLGNYNGIADRISMYNQHVKDPNYLGEDIQRHRRVTSGAVRQFVASSLTKNSRVVIQGVPGQPDFGPEVPTPAATTVAASAPESVNTDEPWRNQQPAPGPRPALTLPPPQSFKLANGLTVVLDTREGVPVVSASLVIRSGTGSNAVNKSGLASLTVDMLEDGTSSRTALQFAEQLARIGSTLGIRTNQDSSAVSIKFIKRNAGAGFDLLADAAMNPTFPEAELERERQVRLGELRQAKENANDVANNVLMVSLYGAENPYGRTTLGTVDSVRRLTREDVRSFWSQHIVPGNAALIVSGDITRQELQQILDKTFGTWKAGAARAAEKKAPSPTKANLVIVDKPGAPQTQLRVALPGPSRSTPDYEPLQAMNAILGGMFSSRINLNLREEHGYSYGASSRFNYLRDTGWFSAASGVRTDVTAPAAREMLREVARMAETPVKAEELSLAKEWLVGALPGRFEMSDQTVGLLTDLYVYDLGMGYYNQYAGKVSALGVDSIQTVARKYLTRQKPIVVAVGDRARIQSALEQLGIGKPEIRDADGAVVK